MDDAKREVEVIVLPNLLYNAIYVDGLQQPLEAVADILDKGDQPEIALALRHSAIICKTFSTVLLKKEAVLYQSQPTSKSPRIYASHYISNKTRRTCVENPNKKTKLLFSFYQVAAESIDDDDRVWYSHKYFGTDEQMQSILDEFCQ